MYLTNLRICPHKCLGQKSRGQFTNLEYDTGKSHTLLIGSARNVCTSRSKGSGRHFLHWAMYRCECRLYPEAATPSGHLHNTLY